MKFLLFFVSFVFSTIFYIFYNLSVGKDILGKKISNTYNLDSFSGNLLIESFVFIFIGIIFIYFFSNFKNKGSAKLEGRKIEIFYLLFYTIFIFYIYFFNIIFNHYLLIIIILFILSDLIFNHISNFLSLIKYKNKLRYVGLVSNYLSTIFAIYFILINEKGLFIPFFILTYNIFFNILIHKKYINYISLLVSIFIILFLFYNLYFLLFELYIYYI